MQTKEDQIYEISDLVYHVLVLMAEKEITPKDIENELEKRSLKAHNLKAERKPVENL